MSRRRLLEESAVSRCDAVQSGINVPNVSQKPAVSVCMADSCEMSSSETSAIYTIYIRLSDVKVIPLQARCGPEGG